MRGLEIEYSKNENPKFKKHSAVAVKPNGKSFSLGSSNDPHKLKELAPIRLKILVENPPVEFRRFLNA